MDVCGYLQLNAVTTPLTTVACVPSYASVE
jgi:hypothetical protein